MQPSSTRAPAARRRHRLKAASLLGAGVLLASGLSVTSADAVTLIGLTFTVSPNPATVGDPITGTLTFTNGANTPAAIGPITINDSPAGTVLFTTATGANGCAGTTFAVSPPNGSGTQTITPTPAALAGNATCVIALGGTVTNVPTPPSVVLTAGVVLSDRLGTADGNASTTLRVRQGTPAVVTDASAGGPVGTALIDTAFLQNRPNGVDGTLTFTLYSDAGCTVPVGTSVVNVGPGNGPYQSAPITPTAAGLYFWRVAYSGDVNTAAASSGCGGAGETARITPVRNPRNPNNPNRRPFFTCAPGPGNNGNNNRGSANNGNNNRGHCNNGNNNHGP